MPEFSQRQRQTHNSHRSSTSRMNRRNPQFSPIGNPLLAQQQALGNQTVQHLLRSRATQMKLTISQPGDKYEQEADRVTEEFMRMSDSEVSGISKSSARIQAECAACASGEGLCPKCAEKDEGIQRKPLASVITSFIQRQSTQPKFEEDEEDEVPSQALTVVPSIGSSINAMTGGGQPLPESVRTLFELRFGYDFSQVRIHADAQAAGLTRRLNARAFTLGRDLVFGAGQYAPGTATGNRLLAHELTHVVQQSALRTELYIQRQMGEVKVTEGPSSEAKDFFLLEDLLRQQISTTGTNLAQVGNRSRLFDAAIAQQRKIITWMNHTLDEAHRLVSDADRSAGADRPGKFEQASARYEAVLIVAQVVNLEINYLIVADQAETAGLPGGHLETILGELAKKMSPILNSIVGFDRRKMAQAAPAAAIAIQEAADFLKKWAEALGVGAELSRKAIAAANAATIVFSLYQAGRAIAAGPGAGPEFRVPVIGGITTGGAAVGVQVAINPQILESIRELIRIGAISAPVAAVGAGLIGKIPGGALEPTGPTLLFRATPSGTVTPKSGSYTDKTVTYGDPRHKHTKVADSTLAELKEARRNPPNKGILKRFVDAVKAGDKTFGSQLSKEATDKYEDLLRNALERGKQQAGKFYHDAGYEIGIEITTGKATRFYRLDGVPSGAHVIPIPELPL